MKNKYIFWVVFSLIIVFLAGVAGGIFIDKYLIMKKPNWAKSEKMKKRPVPFPSLEMMAEELKLTQEQEEKIREIFRNNEERFKNLRGQIQEQLSKMRTQLKEEIMNVLDTEQEEKFEAMLERYNQHLSERRKEMEKRENFREQRPHERERSK